MKLIAKADLDLREPTVVEGLPDVGLAGTLATTFLIEQLKMEEIAHIESDLFPPVMVLHRGILTDPFRIFAKGDLVVITSEMAVPAHAIYKVGEVLGSWLEEIRAKQFISLGGMPVGNRMEISEPKVFGAGNSDDVLQRLKGHAINIMEEGFIAGTYAILMKECLKRGIPATVLLSESFPLYPDPRAAASTLKALNSLLDLKLDVNPLLEKADELRIKLRDLMRQAQASMSGMKKGTEHEIPAMYQ